MTHRARDQLVLLPFQVGLDAGRVEILKYLMQSYFFYHTLYQAE